MTRRRLTDKQRRAIASQLREMFVQGQAQHVGVLARQVPDWKPTGRVMGTSDDVTRTNQKRACAVCHDRVYTSVRYPDDVTIICEVCAYDSLMKQGAAW